MNVMSALYVDPHHPQCAQLLVSIVKNWLSTCIIFRLEDVFFHYGVDIVLQAHEHNYERLYPMYRGVVVSTNYTNPRAPIQIISGAAGSRHGMDQFLSPPKRKMSCHWLGGGVSMETGGVSFCCCFLLCCLFSFCTSICQCKSDVWVCQWEWVVVIGKCGAGSRRLWSLRGSWECRIMMDILIYGCKLKMFAACKWKRRWNVQTSAQQTGLLFKQNHVSLEQGRLIVQML